MRLYSSAIELCTFEFPLKIPTENTLVPLVPSTSTLFWGAWDGLRLGRACTDYSMAQTALQGLYLA